MHTENTMSTILRALILTAILALPAPAAAECHPAALVHVVDGDTFDLLVDGRVLRVRLADADAPERDQPHGDDATDRVAALLAAGPVQACPVATDRYGRTVARVRTAGDDLAWRLVREGLAWPDCHQCRLDDRLSFGIYGVLARWSGAGVWADADPVRPATWRRRHRAEATP